MVVKSNVVSRLSVIDALTAGLATVARRPALIIVPVAIDLILWLAPQLSINSLVLKFFTVWEALARGAYTPAQMASMGDMIDTMREVMTRFGTEANLLDAITGNWLGPSSALLAIQSTRQTFISDTLLAPLGLSLNLPRVASAPWQGAPIEINSFWIAALIFVGFWLIGQFLVAFYFIQCSRPQEVALAVRGQAQPRVIGNATGAVDPPNEAAAPLAAEGDVAPVTAGESTVRPAVDTRAERWHGAQGLLGLAVRLTVFSMLLGVVVLLLRLPLGAAVLMTVFSGGVGTGILFALVGGITLWALLWFLTSVYFSSEGIVFEGKPVWRSVLQSLLMIRGQVLTTFGLVLTVNVVLLGFRAVWGLIGKTPLGGAVAILGNGFLTTAMLLALFVYFGDMRRRWQAREAQPFNSLTRRNQPKDR